MGGDERYCGATAIAALSYFAHFEEVNGFDIRKRQDATKPNIVGSVESVRQRNPPVITKSARGPDDRLLKIAHFELGHCFRKQASTAR